MIWIAFSMYRDFIAKIAQDKNGNAADWSQKRNKGID